MLGSIHLKTCWYKLKFPASANSLFSGWSVSLGRHQALVLELVGQWITVALLRMLWASVYPKSLPSDCRQGREAVRKEPPPLSPFLHSFSLSQSISRVRDLCPVGARDSCPIPQLKCCLCLLNDPGSDTFQMPHLPFLCDIPELITCFAGRDM